MWHNRMRAGRSGYPPLPPQQLQQYSPPFPPNLQRASPGGSVWSGISSLIGPGWSGHLQQQQQQQQHRGAQPALTQQQLLQQQLLPQQPWQVEGHHAMQHQLQGIPYHALANKHEFLAKNMHVADLPSVHLGVCGVCDQTAPRVLVYSKHAYTRSLHLPAGFAWGLIECFCMMQG